MPSLMRHDHIQQNEVDLTGVVLVNLHGVESVFRQQDGIAEFLKRFDQKIPDGFLIIDDQNGFRSFGQVQSVSHCSLLYSARD